MDFFLLIRKWVRNEKIGVTFYETLQNQFFKDKMKKKKKENGADEAFFLFVIQVNIVCKIRECFYVLLFFMF